MNKEVLRQVDDEQSAMANIPLLTPGHVGDEMVKDDVHRLTMAALDKERLLLHKSIRIDRAIEYLRGR